MNEKNDNEYSSVKICPLPRKKKICSSIPIQLTSDFVNKEEKPIHLPQVNWHKRIESK